MTVAVTGDTTPEADEYFWVHVSKSAGVTRAAASMVAWIVDDDQTRLRIGDVTVTEGNADTTNATFTITRTGALGATTTVSWATPTASAGNADGVDPQGPVVGVGVVGSGGADPFVALPDVDFVAGTGTVTFNAGETTKTVSIPVLGDLEAEQDEKFYVTLKGMSNDSVDLERGLATIVDND